jgi:alpha-N-arabinofuranosidase
VQQNTIRDAVVAATALNIFNSHADRVRGANIAQIVNVLQAMILTQGSKMLLTPTYHVFEMYTVHHDALLLPIRVSGAEWYRQGSDSVPAVSASASRDRSGVVHVTLANLDPTRAHDVAIELSGTNASRATGRILTAPAMNSHNTFEQPEAVKPAPFTGARVAGNQLSVALPAHSVVVVELR